MSYRVCAECDYVINNRHHSKYNCPKCDSSKMRCPVVDKRNWDRLYFKQESILFKKNEPNTKEEGND